MEKEQAIIVLRRSRKTFLIEYLCGLFLFGLIFLFYVVGISLHPIMRNIVLGLALLAIIIPELSRLFLVYIVTPTKITIIKGLIQQTKKNVHFIPLGYIPEINMKQNRIQRLLKYGTIFIHGSTQNSFEIRDINRPQEILELIEELIKKNRIPLTSGKM